MSLQDQAKAIAKNIEGKVQETVGNITDWRHRRARAPAPGPSPVCVAAKIRSRRCSSSPPARASRC